MRWWSRPPGPRLLAGGAVVASLVGLLAVAGAARAQEERPGRALLWGGVTTESTDAPLVDPRLPSGALRTAPLALPTLALPTLPAPTSARLPQPLCSWRRPVCAAGPPEVARAALQLLESAYERHRFGAGLPSPTLHEAPAQWLPDALPLRFELTERPLLGFDRGQALCRGGALTPHTAERCLAGLTLLERAPASSTPSVLGFARNVADQLTGFEPGEPLWLDAAQRAPERSLLDAELREGPVDRSALFWRYLDDVSSAGAPAEASFLSLALAATRTRPEALRRQAEPDALDVLRRSLGGSLARFAEFYDDFAASRLELGVPPEFAWDLTSTELPRNVALPRPLEPSGSVYVRLRIAAGDEARRFAVRVTCERPVSYVWSIARRDEAGHSLGRVRLPFRQSDHQFDQHVEPVAGLRELILVGSSLGGVDLAHPYDPEHAPHEAHLCSVYWLAL
ncbi:MAG TPA: hypothetical protein VLC09_05105 [Polyangiaceae bacterium]|nr:hypothetical protein [Polyangiaceae bacterium]